MTREEKNLKPNLKYKKNYRVKVTKDGPYLVSGNLPLSKQFIVTDETGDPEKWREGEKFSVDEEYTLCRCGKSQNQPFCDKTHVKIKFSGEETASHRTYREEAEVINGPDLILMDDLDLCASAAFCDRLSGTWNLTKNSDDPKAKAIAIQQAGDCPAGRLVACDKKTVKPIEPKFKASIGLVEGPKANVSGPIWLRGGVPVESSDGTEYEVRNRVTLCRCGKSKNKPFCDGTHISVGFSDEK